MLKNLENKQTKNKPKTKHSLKKSILALRNNLSFGLLTLY